MSPWEIALNQINLPSFYGRSESREAGKPRAIRGAKIDPYHFMGPPRHLGHASKGPTALPGILEWFINNPDDTITVDDLAIKFNITGSSAYRIQRILLESGEIFRHTRPGRKKGIQYGRLAPLVIPTKQDIRPEPKRKYVRKAL